jgi:hypothetical protein
MRWNVLVGGVLVCASALGCGGSSAPAASASPDSASSGPGAVVAVSGKAGGGGVAGATAHSTGGSAARAGTGVPPVSGTAGSKAMASGGSAAVAGAAGMVVAGMPAAGGGGAAAGMPAGGSAAGVGGQGGMMAAVAVSDGPCDIYEAGKTPCVAAHSTVRALYKTYDGNLYQVRRASDKKTQDIKVLSAGGFADSAAQDTFCMGTSCTISIIYDQSPKHNHLTSAPPGGNKRSPDEEAKANALKLMVGGHPVYAVDIETGVGYRNDKTSGVATGDQAEGEYMVTAGKHYNGGCCFDYGNAETTNNDDGAGTMEAIYFGNSTGWGKGAGKGPWVMADLENGLFAGRTFDANPTNISQTAEYVTAIVKGKMGGFAIKSGDAQMGGLKTLYDGGRPNGYDPMKKQGAIILGIGGDNSNSAVGTFYEGCMTSGYPTDAADDAVQANIVAAGYGH